ncbi:DUF423 domain-containing protein [Mesonia sediminis]|uniref:DUF423 domain-containing protein n=1 Tax=Mesonia sediminis TaxID=1703946 RepID=A0ABW5SDT0_9FLAO
MQDIVISFAAIMGGIAVLLGAFGAHILQRKLNVDQLRSLETAIRYQMFHALALLWCGTSLSWEDRFSIALVCCFAVGILLFSGSIYGLIYLGYKQKPKKFLGPITPLGGLFLIVGWVLLGLEYLL